MCSCPVFPASLIEEAVFSLLYIFASFVIDQLNTCTWVYFWTLFLFIDLCVFFVVVLYYFHDCSFILYSEAVQCDTSSYVLFSENFLVWSLLCSMEILGLFLQVLWEMSEVFWWELYWYHRSMGNMLFLTVLIFPVYEHEISLYLLCFVLGFLCHCLMIFRE